MIRSVKTFDIPSINISKIFEIFQSRALVLKIAILESTALKIMPRVFS